MLNYVQTMSSDMGHLAQQLSRIDDHLFLSDIVSASNEYLTHDKNIKYILTVNVRPIIHSLPPSNYLFIEAEDMWHQDLISYFPLSYQFLNDAISARQNVLVHCVAGQSRSATLVIAYMMKKYKLKYQEAKERVRKGRPIISPNEKFRVQLKLYETMGYEIDRTNHEYRLIALTHLGETLKRQFLTSFHHRAEDVRAAVNQFLAKVDLTTVNRSSSHETVYKCRKCRVYLFNYHNMRFADYHSCSCIFLEPLPWMINFLQNTSKGDIHCPKCSTKIGIYDFSGLPCDPSCEKHSQSLNLPAFKFTKSKVDEHKPTKV
ncbi:uncharacterized protein LOC141856498 [Brevipalpus obovatus]|uniref:uncharacterized protein LOC141856498 n=1 Tax=Brevipalpus obovatus TaxID=246614 RepID=UPI003D9F5A12